MKPILFAVALLACVSNNTRACDLCGCSANNQYLGILPQFYKQFIGIQYQYTSFSAKQASLMDPSEYERAYAFNNTYQLWGRYYIGDRLQFFGFVPYHDNRGNDAGNNFRTTGIGDVSILANALVIKDDSNCKTWHQTLLTGGGVKMPTGKYTGITTLDEQGLPNVQAGTGSWDFIVNANYTVRRDKFGINADAAYTMTTVNTAGYKYGNRLNAGVLGFYWWAKKDLSILPQAGAKYEYTLHDYDNYSRKWLNENSGGSIVFGTIGVQSFYKRYGAKVVYNIPVSEHYSGGNVTVNPRLETSLFFLF
jgi:hypothetical protein